MTADADPSELGRYLDIERRLLAHRAARWIQGVSGPDLDSEERFFDELELAYSRLSDAARAALRELVIHRATIRPDDVTEVDVESPARTGHGSRRLARVG